VLICVAWTPHFFNSSESVMSSRIASRATLALNSGALFFLFVVLDRLSMQAIHLNNWFEIPRLSLLTDAHVAANLQCSAENRLT
jgi:hypothetical protein